MKKIGFTLAEVLITLGIIGVVAALTAPALIQDVGTAQIGPKLAKARSTIEIANQNLMSEKDSNKLTGVLDIIPGRDEEGNLNGIIKNSGAVRARYAELISDYMKIQPLNNGNPPIYYDYKGRERVGINCITLALSAGGDSAVFPQMTSGTGFYISPDGMIYNFGLSNPTNPEAKPHRQIVGSYMVDINGLKGPNRLGRDTFLFTMMNDGSLRPFGDSSMSPNYHWNNGSEQCNSEGVSGRGLTCAGSIFENGLKVIYK